jgi:hypothetical protein
MNAEPTNEVICEKTTRPIKYHSTRRSAHQTTSSYSQVSSLVSSQATSDYGYQEEMDIESQSGVRNSSSASVDIWEKIENEAYYGDDYFDATNGNDCAMDWEDGTLTFSTSSSASSCSSQVNLQEYHPGYEPFMESGMYVDTATMHSSSTKWWHVPEGSPLPVSGAISVPLEASTSRGLQTFHL